MMGRSGRVICSLALAVVMSAGCSPRSGRTIEVTLESSLRALTNTATFAQQPLGRAAMISTYDRSGGNQDWGDFSGATPDGMVTIAELKGPGRVTRFWMTNVPAERFLFFFDGETEPRLSFSKQELSANTFPFIFPVAGKGSGGWHSYLPLPYARSLKIVLKVRPGERNPMPFYHVNYETFPSRAHVQSFPKELNPSEKSLLEEVAKAWRENEQEMMRTAASMPLSVKVDIPAGGNSVLIEDESPGVIQSLLLRISSGEKISETDRARMLRELVLRMYWDGASAPSVEAPVGDFFCNALFYREFSSMPLARVNGMFICRFPMPFRKGARIELGNDGAHSVSVEAGYDVRPLHDQERPLDYFHARWAASTSSGSEHSVLRTTGSGHYVGCYLGSLGMDGTWNILEGDETVSVDGEKTPSLHGTGLEDYFNGAWYYSGLIDRPLYGLLEKAAMRTWQYRFHLLDAVRFDKSIDVNFEFGHGNASKGYMSSVAYWYQTEPRPCGTRLPPLEYRYPPLDPVALATLMCGLFELERIGHWEEARERCLSYAEQVRDREWAAMLRLRAAAYLEKVSGYDAARAEYEALASVFEGSPVSEQAEALMWMHQAPGNALLFSHMIGKYQVAFDGKAVLKGDAGKGLTVGKIELTPGPHEIAFEITPSSPHAWLFLGLRSRYTNMIVDTSWECTKEKPPSWPVSGGADVPWAAVASVGGLVPTMQNWQFAPNAFINTESQELPELWGGWNKAPRTTYCRKVFSVPAQAE